MYGFELVVRMTIVVIERQTVLQAFLVASLPLLLVVCRLLEQILGCLLVCHSEILFDGLVEVVLEALENGVFCLLVALEVVAIFKPL